MKLIVIKEYQMLGMKIPVGTILTKVPGDELCVAFRDKDGKNYIFDSSEMMFSPNFKESFRLIGQNDV